LPVQRYDGAASGGGKEEGVYQSADDTGYMDVPGGAAGSGYMDVPGENSGSGYMDVDMEENDDYDEI